MKRNIIILTILVWFLAACGKGVYEKPKKLIKEKKMIEMLVDAHLAEAAYYNQNYRGAAENSLTYTDLYYSVLQKYNVPDSVFEKSFVYYASKPKVFEKIYRQVTNRLIEIEEEQKIRQNEILEFEDTNK